MTVMTLRKADFSSIAGFAGPNVSPLIVLGGAQHKVFRAATNDVSIAYLGESAELDDEPTAADNSLSPFHVLTVNGITRMTVAAAPAIVDRFLFESGGGRWLAMFGGAFLATPLKNGGVQTINATTGAVISSLPYVSNDSRYGTALVAEGFLWVVDGQSAKIRTLAVNTTTGVMTYVGVVAAPNCRDIVRVVLDATEGYLFVVCRNRIVRFTVPTTAVTDTDDMLPVFAQDYGRFASDITDFVVIGADQYWVGWADSTAVLPTPLYEGPARGLWDTTTTPDVLVVAAPMVSTLAVTDTVPYYTSASFTEVV